MLSTTYAARFCCLRFSRAEIIGCTSISGGVSLVAEMEVGEDSGEVSGCSGLSHVHAALVKSWSRLNTNASQGVPAVEATGSSMSHPPWRMLADS